ncbi:putative chromatin remodeler Bromodomain family [Helianthus annuus]|nr:putative chromatin remodeler Bromodomain family [Helianthus annuus]
MTQIVKRKRRGRPSNIDRARRNSQLAPPSPADRRSTRRRRNVREKKIRLLLFDDEVYTRKRLKKRKLDEEVEEVRGRKFDDEDEENEEDEEEEEAGGSDFDCGTASDVPKRVPMPDKKTLELILDKLQKKDIYGVYAEPVDPEELPDYHDVIKHPMDFATIRKKLAKGLYLSLKEFESDVFLICTNAMQYNAPDTVYYKQASSIQELAKLKFQRLRDNTDPSEKELNTDHKTTPSFSMPKNN